MLQVDIRELRQGPVDTVGVVPSTDSLFEGLEVSLVDGLHVNGVLSETGQGDYLWRGQFSGKLNGQCRRCLKDLVVPIDTAVDALFSADPEMQDDPSVYPLPEHAAAIDVGAAVREELALAVSVYPLCREDCAGLCPKCGADLNLGPCECGSPSH